MLSDDTELHLPHFPHHPSPFSLPLASFPPFLPSYFVPSFLPPSLFLPSPSPDKVATGILELILDTSKVGAVMTVTQKRGIDYFVRLPGQKVEQSKAKL